jgi:hypothetical protein
MKTIEYSPTGKHFADQECEHEARKFLTSPTETLVVVSSELFILAVRCLIHEGVIPHTEVRFLFDGQYIQPNANGRLPDWSIGFCDKNEILLARLLRNHCKMFRHSAGIHPDKCVCGKKESEHK